MDHETTERNEPFKGTEVSRPGLCSTRNVLPACSVKGCSKFFDGRAGALLIGSGRCTQRLDADVFEFSARLQSKRKFLNRCPEIENRTGCFGRGLT